MGVDNFMSGIGSKRATRRARVLLNARLQTATGEFDCRLRDLSRKGALIESDHLPPVDSEVVFIRGRTHIPARVAWTSAGRAGLEFLRMIDERDMLVEQPKLSPPPALKPYRRPGLRVRMSEDVRRLADEWGVTVGLTVPTD